MNTESTLRVKKPGTIEFKNDGLTLIDWGFVSDTEKEGYTKVEILEAALTYINESLVREIAGVAADEAQAVAPAVWVNSIMEKVQEFASTWALVGSKFDGGGGVLELAEDLKEELRVMLSTTTAEPVQQEPVIWECKAGGLKPLTQSQYDKQTDKIKDHYTLIPAGSQLPADVVRELVEVLEKVALIAHHGGLVDLTERDALILIRKLTGGHHDWKSTIAETRRALKSVKEHGL